MQIRWKYFLAALTLIIALVWITLFGFPDKNLRLIACDVGQGDAVLIEHMSTQILVDGGPNNKVLNCLAQTMPFWDRTIEVVILTHPQKDHLAGLIHVFERYKVLSFITTPLDSSSQEFEVLKKQVGGLDTSVINPKSGMRIRAGLIYLDILWPSQEFLLENTAPALSTSSANSYKPMSDLRTGLESNSQQSANMLGSIAVSKDLNDFSIVTILSFKDFDALLTGDIGPEISDTIAKVLEEKGKKSIEYIKIPHHGSKNGLSKSLLGAVEPKVAVISSGRNNIYGHPHQEVIKLLRDYRVKILRTDEMGDVVIETDGEKIWLRKYSL